ncbi:MAG: glutamate--tRNA ligase [Clostridiales bacterium]|nr:glutamate--tRNA ligase [Clostridiales bacterium]
MLRTRFAPSPTGYMHIGNLRTALYGYLLARRHEGAFVLRIEDTDQARLVEGAVKVIFDTLRTAGISHDEGPDVGGEYGPYVQSERKEIYLSHANELISQGKAYRCFCGKERLDTLVDKRGIAKYDKHCLGIKPEESKRKADAGEPYVIRQLIPDGETSFQDIVYGEIKVSHSDLDDMILIKSDGMPTYNFANVVDDHLMGITHVVRGNEYLSSTPKYNLLYEAFGWELPTYIHLPLINNESGEKLSKRHGDASFEDLLKEGYLPEAVVNYIALLGWSPKSDREIYSLDELCQVFDLDGLNKSPSIFDKVKLAWMNGEYFKKMDPEKFYELAEETLKSSVKAPQVDLKKVAAMVQTRINFLHEIPPIVDFIDNIPEFPPDLFVHKKMKTDIPISLENLKNAYASLETLKDYSDAAVHLRLFSLIAELGVKNSQVLWPVRTALSGKPTSPCGGTELCALLGKDETLKRIQKSIEMLEKHVQSLAR